MAMTAQNELRALSEALRELLLEDYELNDRVACDGARAMELFRLKRSAPAPAQKQRRPAVVKKPPKAAVKQAKPAAAPKEPPKAEPLPPLGELNPEPAFTLERVDSAISEDFVNLRNELHELFPQLKFIASPPDDSQAKAKAEQWKRRKQLWQALVLTNSDRPEEQRLLQNLCTAISRLLVPAGQLKLESATAEGTWERIIGSRSLRLVIAELETLKANSKLAELIQGEPPQLGELPILELGPLSSYLNDPGQKKALWSAIKERLGS